MESDVKSHNHNGGEEPRCITRGQRLGQLDKMYGSTAQVSNVNKTNK